MMGQHVTHWANTNPRRGGGGILLIGALVKSVLKLKQAEYLGVLFNTYGIEIGPI